MSLTYPQIQISWMKIAITLIITEELLDSDTTLLANTYLPNLCHHIHYYEDDGIVIYSKYLGNPTADAYTITLNLRLRQESSDDFIITYDIK